MNHDEAFVEALDTLDMAYSSVQATQDGTTAQALIDDMLALAQRYGGLSIESVLGFSQPATKAWRARLKTLPPDKLKALRTIMGDEAVDELLKQAAATEIQAMLAGVEYKATRYKVQYPALDAAMAKLKVATAPKMTPADPMDTEIDFIRDCGTQAAQHIGDQQIRKEMRTFGQRLLRLAGIAAPTAGGTLTDRQKPTTKATEPATFDAWLMPGMKGAA